MESGLLADTAASICAIPGAEAFSGLTEAEKMYAHHMCRVAFHGTRILLRQTSQESESIYDLICELFKAAEGNWLGLARHMDVSQQEIDYFLEYAAMFLGNLGNYRSTGDEKFIPRVNATVLGQLCQVSPLTRDLFDAAVQGMYANSPYKYGYSADISCNSGYYPGPERVSEDDITAVQNYLQRNQILPENTRVAKAPSDRESPSFIVHVASSDPGAFQKPDITCDMDDASISLVPGDFSDQLGNVVQELELSIAYTATEEQRQMVRALIKSFRTGNHEHFKTAQTFCVTIKAPFATA